MQQMMALHPLHPLNNDYPITSIQEWTEYTTGQAEYPRYDKFVPANQPTCSGSKEAMIAPVVPRSKFQDWFDVVAISFVINWITTCSGVPIISSRGRSSTTDHKATAMAAADAWLFNSLTAGLCSLLITRKKASAETVFMLGLIVNVSLPSATALELICHQHGISLVVTELGLLSTLGLMTLVWTLCNCKMAYRDSNTVHTQTDPPPS